MVSVRQAPKHYFVELLASLLLYFACLHWRHSFVHTHSDASFLRTLVLLSPVVPCILIAAAIVRLFHRTDEMHKRRMLEQVGIGALVCALASISLGFSQDLGLPPIGIMWAWPLIGIGWLAANIWQNLAASVAQQGIAATASQSLLVTVFVLAPTAVYWLLAPSLGWPHQLFSVLMVGTLMIVIQAGWAIYRRQPK